MVKKKKFTPKSVTEELERWSDSGSDDDNEDEVDSYHTNKEKELLGKSVFAQDNESDEEDNDDEDGVMPFDDDSSGSDEDDNTFNRFSVELKKDEMASDIEESEDDLPDATAWGNKRTDFYYTDYVDKDFRSNKQKEDALAQYEEEEALAIQKRLLESMAESDVGLEMLMGSIEPKRIDEEIEAEDRDENEEKLQTNISNLTQRQKMEILRKEAPELESLVSDFKAYMTELNERLLPLMEAMRDDNVYEPNAIKYIETRFHIISNYCLNICFYLALKSKRIPVKDHPVIKQILSFKKLLIEMNAIKDKNKMIEKDIDSVLEILKSGQKLTPINELNKKRKAKDNTVLDDKTGKRVKFSEGLTDEEDSQPNHLEEDEDNEEDAAKRGITYEMQKNKGLTAKRKKELKNPRVKHRMKYRKAKIRRKGQVREPRKEVQRYGGELSGIKSGVVKSVKFK